MLILIQLFYEFFKAGLFAIGGGLATLPFLYEMAEKTGWFSVDDIANMIAISEATPGALGINIASGVGYLTAGIPGSIIATLGLACPSIIIILIIAAFLKKFRENAWVNNIFYGLRAASIAMIAAAGYSVAKTCLINEGSDLAHLFNYQSLILFIVLLLMQWKVKLHPVIYIIIAAIVGIIFKF